MKAKLLVANRGEIALRIIRTCRKMGIRTVMVYSDPDQGSLPLLYADERFRLPGATPTETYLNIPRIIEAATQTKCDAVHPGYGFLAEDSDFVRACEENNLIFIGPSSSSLERLGSKLVARKTMKDAAVPVIPGSDGPVTDEAEAVQLAQKIGYPVILKAVFGGGGRGMRIANNADEVRRFYRVTRLESKAAFGREAIYIEKRLVNPRHVEIQAIADRKAKVVSLGERECSIQRRHQKLLEEAPSPAVSASLREELTEAAKKGLMAAQYLNAGTVEFLLDESGEFYFLEVNKRLQVEHLVTEMTTGVDLVEAQLNVAFDSTLNLSENEVKVNGWAINCRINAEDPRRDFVPSPAAVEEYHAPSGPGVRVDSALFSGYKIPEYYDSMIAKLSTWGRTRSESCDRMRTALDELVIFGVPTTIPLHRLLMRDRGFLNGDFHTNYLDEMLPKLNDELLSLERIAAVAAVATRIAKPSMATPPRSTTRLSRWRDHSRTRSIGRWGK